MNLFDVFIWTLLRRECPMYVYLVCCQPHNLKRVQLTGAPGFGTLPRTDSLTHFVKSLFRHQTTDWRARNRHAAAYQLFDAFYKVFAISWLGIITPWTSSPTVTNHYLYVYK